MEKRKHEELVIADLNTLNVFKFVDTKSDGQAELLQAQEYLENQAKSLKALIADCQRPDFRKQWEESLQSIRKTEYRIVPIKDFYAAERKKMLSDHTVYYGEIVNAYIVE